MKPAIKNLDDVEQRVKDSGGVICLHARTLRDAVGQQKLGVHVRRRISEELAGRGLAHAPTELPDSQEEPVLVFRQGSQVARIIDAVRSPSKDGAILLRQAAQEDAQRTLDQVRALLEP